MVALVSSCLRGLLKCTGTFWVSSRGLLKCTGTFWVSSRGLLKCTGVRPRIRKGPFLELALPVLVWVPVLEWADFLIPVLELAPCLESPYAQAAISRTSTTNFVPF